MRPWLLGGLACAALVAVLGGCYRPSPPSGAYTCNDDVDEACPRGQQCVCGLCVDRARAAVCTLALDTGGPISVAEHQPFRLRLSAYGPSGAAAADFNGVATLTASWGEVRPATVRFSGGHAEVMASLNRETVPPQTVVITAGVGSGVGTSPGLGVHAPPMTRDAQPVVAPPSKAAPFGFADAEVAGAQVVPAAHGFVLYFNGVSSASGWAIGVADSPDGVAFTPRAQPLFTPGGPLPALLASAVFDAGAGRRGLVYPVSDANKHDALGLAWSTGGGPFVPADNSPVVSSVDCSYCTFGVWFPAPVPDVRLPGAQLLYFTAVHFDSDLAPLSIGRAAAADGMSFMVDPVPVLAGQLTGEKLIGAPAVALDGSVYKMWYAVSRQFASDFCAPNAAIEIGYATSSDGVFWIRSPSNPVLPAGSPGWGAAPMPTAVVPRDGRDPASGFTLYFSSFTSNLDPNRRCILNGIGRAVRP